MTVESPLADPTPEKTALEKGMRMALKRALANQLEDAERREGESTLKTLLDEPRPYIREWRLIERRPLRDSQAFTYRITVDQEFLNKILFLRGHRVKKVYDWIGRPRIVVAVKDYVEGGESLTRFAASELERLLVAKGLRVFSSDQLAQIRVRDVELAFADAGAAAALGKRLGAEILIAGKAHSDFSRKVAIEGTDFHFYSTNLQLKAVHVPTGEVLLAAAYTTPKGTDTSAMGKPDAVSRSILSTVQPHSWDLVYQLVKAWQDRQARPKVLQLFVWEIGEDLLSPLEEDLKKIPGVARFLRRNYRFTTAEYEVEFSGSQATLVQALRKISRPRLELVAEEETRITVAVKQ